MPTTLLIDVRTPEEFADGGREGAINIPLQNILNGDFGAIADVPLDTRIECYCASGGRSEMARRVLIELGYTDVVNLGGVR